jgi:lipopolysaccharide transport system permease protein
VDGEVARPLPIERVIRRRRGLVWVNFPELWRYRELFVFMAWREVLVKYKQTGIGILWAFIRPLLTMLVFTVVFGRVAKLPSGGVPYPLFTLAALLPWQFFSTSVTSASSSLVKNETMITKIYFPRLIIPTSAILAYSVDFLISMVIMVGLMIWYHVIPGFALAWLPLFGLMLFVCSLGPSMWLAALNVQYRDVQQAVPFMVQLGMYVSPVGFGLSLVPEKWRLLYSLNPMVGVIEGFRWSLLGQNTPFPIDVVLLSCGVGVVLLISGVLYFKKMERIFADVI